MRGIHPDRWFPFINGSVMPKAFRCHDVFMAPVLFKVGVAWRAVRGATSDYQFWGSQCLCYCDNWHYVITLLDAMLSVNSMSISYSLLFSMHVHLWPICDIIGHICCPALLWHHDDVIKWKHFPRYWPFVQGIHRSSVNSPHKGQWRGALMFSLICIWINGWVRLVIETPSRSLWRHCNVTWS